MVRVLHPVLSVDLMRVLSWRVHDRAYFKNPSGESIAHVRRSAGEWAAIERLLITLPVNICNPISLLLCTLLVSLLCILSSRLLFFPVVIIHKF